MNQASGYGVASSIGESIGASYPADPAERQSEIATIASRLAANNEKLAVAAHRICCVLDRLHGPRPEPVANQKDTSQPSALMGRIHNEIDISASLAGRINELANRLDGLA